MNNHHLFVSRRQIWGLFLVAMLAGEIAGPARAQVTASVSGRVEDASGAAVGGAAVMVTSLETGANRMVTADAAGTYRVLLLPVERYEVKAEAPASRPPSRPESAWRLEKRPW